MKKEIRRLIREAIKWYIMDKGMPHFWSSENYKYASEVFGEKVRIGNPPYYVRSDRAIKEIAEKIHKLKKSKIGKDK